MKMQEILTEAESRTLYHVTLTKHVAGIQQKGILPLQTSNWVKAGDKSRYGSGEVFAFTDKRDAAKWAGKMDWEFNKKLGSGQISIVTFVDDGEWDIDDADPLAQAGKSGTFLKRRGRVKPEQIESVEPFTVAMLRIQEAVIDFDKARQQKLQTNFVNKLKGAQNYLGDYQKLEKKAGEALNALVSEFKDKKQLPNVAGFSSLDDISYYLVNDLNCPMSTVYWQQWFNKLPDADKHKVRSIALYSPNILSRLNKQVEELAQFRQEWAKAPNAMKPPLDIFRAIEYMNIELKDDIKRFTDIKQVLVK